MADEEEVPQPVRFPLTYCTQNFFSHLALLAVEMSCRYGTICQTRIQESSVKAANLMAWYVNREQKTSLYADLWQPLALYCFWSHEQLYCPWRVFPKWFGEERLTRSFQLERLPVLSAINSAGTKCMVSFHEPAELCKAALCHGCRA